METSKFSSVKTDREITTHKDARSSLHKYAEAGMFESMIRYGDMCVNLKYVRTIEKINRRDEDIISFHFNNGDYLDWKFKTREPDKETKDNQEAEPAEPAPCERDQVFEQILKEFRAIEI